MSAVLSAKLIDGKSCAARLRREVAADVACLVASGHAQPCLAVVLVGSDAASEVYVRSKVRHTEEAGMRSLAHSLPADVGERELLELIARLNGDRSVHGILVQLPLPPQIDTRRVLEAIDPAKDVDGFHPLNAGRLANGAPSLVPCTPLGCLFLIRTVRRDLAGLDALVVGCSTIVGRPMAQLLLAEECTVTMAHARTRDLPSLVRNADLVVVAAGRPGLIRGDWIKPGAIVIDVGINRVTGDDGRSRLVGDVEFDAARAVAGAITPVPGGVGPMTIACLLRNTLDAARVQAAS